MTIEQFIGIAITDARRARNWDQKHLAGILHICTRTLGRIERGVTLTRGQQNYWAHLKAIAEALNTTPGGLLIIAEAIHGKPCRKPVTREVAA